MATSSVPKLSLPQRPPITSATQITQIATKIKLVSNLFPLSVEGNSSGSDEPDHKSASSIPGSIKCFQYDVEFDPEVALDNRALRYKIFKQGKQSLEAEIGRFCFSGKSLFTLKSLSKEKLLKISTMKSTEAVLVDGQKYSMKIRFTKEFALDQEEAKSEGQVVEKKGNKITQVLNIVLKQVIRDQKNPPFQEIGKNSKFFNCKDASKIQIKDRNDKIISTLEAYKGFQFGIHPSAKQLYLMVDYASRILRQETALQFIRKNPSNLNSIVGQSVITQYNNYQIYKIDGVLQNKNPKSTFLNKATNLQISFAEYYKNRYQITITDMAQPLLLHIRKFREANTNIQKTEEVFLIPEICKMTGMTDEERSDFKAMKEVATHTKLSPKERFLKSQEFGNMLSKGSQSSGLKIATNNSTVDAYQMNPPTIYFGGNKNLVPTKGNFDQRAPICDKGTVFSEWSFVHQQRDRDQADDFIKQIKNCSQTYGITIEDPFYFEINSLNSKDWIRELENDFNKNGAPRFVVTFAPQIPQSRNLYGDLKKFLYNEVGLEHQHVNPNSLKKNIMSVCSKISLQIAAKLGKQLWKVQIPQGLPKNTMLIGIETSMKKIVDKKILKQAVGVVASLNQDFSSYYSEVEVRADNDVALPNLSGIIKKSLEAYLKKNKSLPELLIVYRQGLGEGQIIESLRFEMQAIKNGCEIFQKGYNPQMTFFQVNKKIGQKFYRKDNDNYDNPQSGALIADGVVGKNFEFYLCAQNCNSGVCTPTKYSCLFNDSKVSEATLWQLTYFQCFNYYNWQGPVRVPAPMMYAGKLAKFTSEVLGEKSNDQLVHSLYYL